MPGVETFLTVAYQRICGNGNHIRSLIGRPVLADRAGDDQAIHFGHLHV